MQMHMHMRIYNTIPGHLKRDLVSMHLALNKMEEEKAF